MFIYRLRGRRISKNGLSETHERERKMQMQDANETRGTTSGPNLDLTTQPTDFSSTWHENEKRRDHNTNVTGRRMKYTRKHTEEDSELQKQLGGGSNLTTGRPRPRAVQVSKRMLCTNAIAANRKPYVVVVGRVGGDSNPTQPSQTRAT